MTGSAAYSQVTYSLTVPISIELLLYTDFFGIIINQSINENGKYVHKSGSLMNSLQSVKTMK
jgi:hypothetical protein